MEKAIKQIDTLKFIWRAINDLTGRRSFRNEISLPDAIGEFKLVRPILEDKKNNKFQYGIYKDISGKEYIAKQLSLKDAGIDEYWLRNEINVYSILTKLQEKKGNLIEKSFPDIKIPKLVSVSDNDERLLCLTEKISGKDLSDVSVEDRVKNIERVLGYFRFLNTIHDFKNENLIKRSFLNMVPLLMLAALGASIRHPGECLQILNGTFTVIRNLPFLLTRREKAFVHRDIDSSNVFMDSLGNNFVIDFELSSYMNPMWEVVHAVVGCRRKEGFLETFSKTGTIQNIMNDKKSRKLYKILSIYCGIHLLSTSGRNEEQVSSDKRYMQYAMNI